MRNRIALLALVFCTRPLLAATLYWGGGSGNWSGNSNWYSQANLGGSAQNWVNGSDAVINSGSVAVNSNVTAANLHVAAGAEARIGGGNEVLEVQGALTGTGTIFFTRTAKANASGLYINSNLDQTIPTSLRVQVQDTRYGLLRIGGAGVVTLNGFIQGNGKEFIIELEANAHLIFGPDCKINNNLLPELVNAKTFFVRGAGPSSVMEFHPDFNADMADPLVRESVVGFALPSDDPGDGTYVKPVGGLSTLRGENVTLLTHASQNLATIHKYTGGTKRYTHHGLWMFDMGTQPAWWTTRGSPQSYDGGIYYNRNWTLNTESDFTFAAVWHDGVNVGFGSKDVDNTLVTKTGSADLIFTGTQAYRPGSVLRVTEGRVLFYSNPDITSFPHDLSANTYMNGTGNYLQLEVPVGGSAAFYPPVGTRFGMYSASVGGTLVLRVNGSSGNTALLGTASSVAITGTLQVEYSGNLTQAEYLLLDAGSLTWTPALVQAPPGWQVERSGNRLWLRPSGVPLSYAAWVGETFSPAVTQTDPLDTPWQPGVTNLARYGLGIEPAEDVPAAQMPAMVLTDTGPAFRFTRPAPSLRPDLHYSIEVRENLMEGDWVPVDESLWDSDITGDTETILLPLSRLPGTPDSRFCRVRITLAGT